MQEKGQRPFAVGLSDALFPISAEETRPCVVCPPDEGFPECTLANPDMNASLDIGLLDTVAAV